MRKKYAIRSNIPKYIEAIADDLNNNKKRRWLNLVSKNIMLSPYDLMVINKGNFDKLIIHDTTLREGEQTPGVTMSVEGKVSIGRELDRVGIQQIEAGFPRASKKQFEVVKRLANGGLKANIFGFARGVKADIDSVAESDAYGVVLSYSVSPIMREIKFRATEEEYLNKVAEVMSYAKDYGLYVVYSAEDSTRTPIKFLKKAFQVAAEAGMDRARIVDTLGCIIPDAMKLLVGEVKKTIDKPIEVHCHDDLGLATANSFAALIAGASTVSSSVHGIGERAGVTSTEEIAVILRLFYGVKAFKIDRLPTLSRLVADITGIAPPPMKPVIGDNAFMHKAGIHAHGMSKDRRTYETFPPEMIGRKRKFVLSELSGKYSVKQVVKTELGMDISDKVAEEVAEEIKRLYSRGRRSPILPDELRRMIKRA